jgi:formate C-acetyltransferase
MPSIHSKFKSGAWKTSIDVQDFIQQNYTPYKGGKKFLAKPTERTKKILKKVTNLVKKEHAAGGVLDIDTATPSKILSHKPGYIDKKNDLIVGLQTDKPLKRSIKPKGGIRLVKRACESYGYTLDPQVESMFANHVNTHNDGVFGVYKNWSDFRTPDGQLLRKKGIITGLPDNYGRGRVIGDYRRVALYGVDRLIEDKVDSQERLGLDMNEDLQMRQEIAWQVKALKELKAMAAGYGFDISKPATNFKEAVQWLYFGYLGAIKEQDGAAMSMGRIDAFLDIYAQKDLRAKRLTETKVQEIIDDFVLKLRLVRHLRVPEYNELFAGDPTWVTCVLGGQGVDKRTLVTKMAFRFLRTLENLGAAPEPNITVLWSNDLPESFKSYASETAIKSSSIQFENDDLMRPTFGDDYGIACCVSAMAIGKQMQFFGARCNLPKLLLMSINEGKDELDNSPISDEVPRLKHHTNLKYREVKTQFFKQMKWMAKKYVETMNLIHYMHDHNNYENVQMALHNTDVKRFMAFGIAGISIVADSLSAIKYGKVTAVRNKQGVATAFEIRKDFPTYGSDDDRVDNIAIEVVEQFIKALREHKTYRDAEHTLSLLTITANVVYGHHTGATPDGRESGTPFAPGANPMHNRDKSGAISSLNSVAKIPYPACMDGISNTFSMNPSTLGKTKAQCIQNLNAVLDGYFKKRGHHLNVNVLDRDTLRDAMKHPSKYPNLTIRVSGYAVRFVNLNKEQQEEVISRTFHKSL